MDIQALVDALGDASRKTRSDYHLTLGAAIEALGKLPPEIPVRLDSGDLPGDVDSYRGYYSDLAFGSAPSRETVTAAEVLADLKMALGSTFRGYKGGDFKMGPDTPLWVAPYGSCGPAVVGLDVQAGTVVLITKSVD